jgi:hypothetical protein
MLIQGKSLWAKITGSPVAGYGNTYNEWTVDLVVDKKTQEALTKAGFTGTFKQTKDGETFIRLRRKELNGKGERNAPIEIIDHHGQPWGRDKIGNGSTLNVSLSIFENKFKNTSVWVNKIQVWDLVEYAGREEDFPVKNQAETKQEAWDEPEGLEEVA